MERWYAALLRLYPRSFRRQFGTSMEQTFRDLCREEAHRSEVFGVQMVRIFGETSIGIAKERAVDSYNRNKPLTWIAGVTAVLLSIPLIMTLKNPQAHLRGGTGGAPSGWDWTLLDFAVMGCLLLATGFAMLFALRLVKQPLGRAIAVAGIVGLFLAVWAELAVGAVSQLLVMAGL